MAQIVIHAELKDQPTQQNDKTANIVVENLCAYENRVCNRRALRKEKYCDLHIFTIPRGQPGHVIRCSFVYQTNSMPCLKPAIESSSYSTPSYCFKHHNEMKAVGVSTKVEFNEPASRLPQKPPVENSAPTLMQLWEKQEDILFPQSRQDLLDHWSSDGDSISSSSQSDMSSDDGEVDVETCEAPGVQRKRNMRLLRRAQRYTVSEGLHMALDRWQRYLHYCHSTLRLLRTQLMHAYVPYAVHQHYGKRQKMAAAMVSETPASKPPPANLELRRHMLERRALKRFGRYSNKVANERYNTYMSKFAIMCSHIAPWRRPGLNNLQASSSSTTLGQSGAANLANNLASSANYSAFGGSWGGTQHCKYRDPTTTTWERHCTEPAIPLLSYCLNHIVQLNYPRTRMVTTSAKSPPPSASTIKSLALDSFRADSALAASSPTRFSLGSSSGGSSPVNCNLAAGSFPDFVTGDDQLDDITAASASLFNCTLPSVPEIVSSPVATAPETTTKKVNKKMSSSGPGVSGPKSTASQQVPMQFLFRHCGEPLTRSSGAVCMEPVVNWNAHTRCSQHTSPETIWPLPSTFDPPMTKLDMALTVPPTEIHPLIKSNFLLQQPPLDETGTSTTLVEESGSSSTLVFNQTCSNPIDSVGLESLTASQLEFSHFD